MARPPDRDYYRIEVWDNVDGKQVIRVVHHHGHIAFEGFLDRFTTYTTSNGIKKATLDLLLLKED